MSNEKKVLETLKSSKEPLRPGDIALKTELTKADVDKAITQLKKNDLIFSPKRCFYSAK